MFNQLSDRLTHTLKKLTGQAKLTEENIKESLGEIRKALLEADVALPVINTFIDDVQSKAIGQEVVKSLKPGETLVKVVYDELVRTMGESCAEINFNAQPPVVILVAGLQGAGKTTTVAKLANWLIQRQKKSVLVTSADIYRPAAIEQLATLAQQIKAHHHPSDPTQDPVNIAKAAITAAKKQFIDVVIVDTAGR